MAVHIARLAIDEDRMKDTERKHTTEQVANLVFDPPLEAEATDATLTMANPVDLTPYGSAELTFDWFIEKGFETGEYLALDFSPDGSSWTEIKRLRGNVDQENTWHNETISIDPAYLTAGYKLRFRAKVSGSREDANVDNIKLIATSPSGPPNEVPLAGNDAYSVSEDGSLNVSAVGVLAGDTDADGLPLTAVLDIGPANGSLNLSSDGSFTYTLDANFNGMDSFTYRANDGMGDSNVATAQSPSMRSMTRPGRSATRHPPTRIWRSPSACWTMIPT